MQLGRYVVHDAIGAGGMATVHLGRMMGPLGFGRTVAIKRMHPHLAAAGGELVRMFLDEARMAARVQHPNVVSILDVVSQDGESFLVMEYVNGESLGKLISLSEGRPIPIAVVKALLVGMLHGLHAAHDATDERGVPLGMIHRDVSPQNVIVGVDGVVRIVDFGVAKARGRQSDTADGQLKGKLAYMAPEQVEQAPVDRRTDIFAAGIVAWETLTGRRLYTGDNEVQMFVRVLAAENERPTVHRRDVGADLDAIVIGALARSPDDRFQTAMEMADAIERGGGLATVTEMRAWVDSLAGESAAARARRIVEIESTPNLADLAGPGGSAPKFVAQPTAVAAAAPIEVFGEAMPLPRMSMESVPAAAMTTPHGAAPAGYVAGGKAMGNTQAKKRSRTPAVIVALAVLATAAIAIGARASSSRAAAAEASSPVATAADVAPTAAPPESIATAPFASAASPTDAGPAVSMLSIELPDTPASASPLGATPATAVNASTRKNGSAAGAKHAADAGACSYSSYVGADGIKRYARVCP